MGISTFLEKVPPLYWKMYVYKNLLGGLTTYCLYLYQAQFTPRIKNELSDLHFFFLSDVWLDYPQTLIGLQKLFDNCIENSFVPKLIVLCGNFTSQSISQGNARDVQRYQGAYISLRHWISADYSRQTISIHSQTS